MIRASFINVTFLLALGWTSAANGQPTDSGAVPRVRLEPGAELRVWERDRFGRLEWKRVEFRGWSADTIVGEHIVRGTTIRLLPDSAPRIDLMVGRGSRQGHVLTGAAIGLVVGTAFAYAVISALPIPCDPECPTKTEKVVFSMYWGGTPVAVVGALIGSAFPAPKKWAPIRPAP